MDSSFFMEPNHLENDEVEHELNIRGMPPQITRLRSRNLRERLLMEMRKEVAAPADCLNPDLALEITIVLGKLKQLECELINAAESNCFKLMEVLASRLYHLYGRLIRVKSDDHRIINQQEITRKKIVLYIEILHLSLEGKLVMKEQLKTLNLAAVDEARASTPIPPLETRPVPRMTAEQCRALLPIPEDKNVPTVVTEILKRPEVSGPRSNAGEDLSLRIGALELSDDSDSEISAILLKNLLSKRTGTIPKTTNKPVTDFQGYQASGFTSNLVRHECDVDEAFFARQPRRDNTNVFREEVGNRIPAPRDPGIRQNPVPRPVERIAQAPANPPLREMGDVEERRRFRNRNPILNWQLVFTGVQGQGLSVSDFVTQVSLMARADSVTEQELFLSAIHLFAGSARNWYVAFERYYDNWQQLVHALKEQFLPHDSDLSLLREAESRKQRSDETFVLFLASMMNMFDHLQVELPEARKLNIVMRNMLPYLRQALALTEVQDFHVLVRLCRKLESIRSTTVPTNVVSEVVTRTQQQPDNGNGPYCHNCQETGHLHPDCRHPKIRVFCYRCGELGQLANTCTKCRQVQGNQQSRPSFLNHLARDGH